MKRLLSVLLALALIFACAPVMSLQANAEEYTSGYYTYTVINGEATIINCDMSIRGRATIPATLGSYPVTYIGDAAFSDCYNLNHITIPNSVKSIGRAAFNGCESLFTVNIPSSVAVIGDGAFFGCYNLTVYLDEFNTSYYVDNNGVLYDKEMTRLVFAPTNLKGQYVIPSSVIDIERGAFWYCWQLEEVTIPKGVINIGVEAFYNCIGLTTINLPDSIISIGTGAFEGCTRLTSIVIPSSVKSLGESTFYGCTSLTRIVIPNRVRTIGVMTFAYCRNLTNITIPDSVYSIGSYAFLSCSSLSDVYYSGTYEQWGKIGIGSEGNDDLMNNAILHCNVNDLSWAKAAYQYSNNGEEKITYYETFEEAFASATNGTLKLLADATADTILLKPGVTLDLNGYTLTADSVIVFNGATILDGGENCTGGGLLKVPEDNLGFMRENGQGVIPVWNGVDGYVFTKVTFQQLAMAAGEGAAQYIFLPTFSNAEAAALMADGGTDNGLKIKVSLTWGNGQSQQFYTYSDDLVQKVFDGTGRWVFSLTVTGISGITDMTANAVVVTDTGAQATASGTTLVAG